MLAFCGVSTVAEVVRILIKAVLFPQATSQFRSCVDQFYSQAFCVYHQDDQEGEGLCWLHELCCL